MQSYDPDQRKVLSALCHGACFFSAAVISVGIPIAILFLSNDSVVKANAREALNFQISVYIAGLISAALLFILIGIPMLIAVLLFSFIAPIIAIIKVLDEPDKPYRYALILHLL